MKVVEINATCGIGSTGKICVDISEMLIEQGVENYVLYSCKSNGYEFGIKCSDEKYIKRQSLKSHVIGNYGFQSVSATHTIIKELDRICPDIVHLHNIHGHDCNLEILFNYLKKNKIKVVWTFHDCWAFTGYCTHFTLTECSKWKEGCNKCPQFRKYSFFFDRSENLYKRKKELFEGVDLTIITPSKWLANLVEQSFLKNCTIKVINNGIDLSLFRPTNSDFRGRYNIPLKKKIVLGVSFGWGYSKGLDVFIELAKLLDARKYQIVLVGTNEVVDKQLPQNIISIHRTDNQQELASIYTEADVFVNPTREDVLGMVNIEAIACGTPVITFNTGGCPECIDSTCGSVVNTNDIDAMYRSIVDISNKKDSYTNACQNYAKRFEKSLVYKKYYETYQEIENE